MKTELTIEQSAKLIERGVQSKRASKAYGTFDSDWRSINHPVFTFTDLLSILPKSITVDGVEYHIDIYTRPNRRECWVVRYIHKAGSLPFSGAGEQMIDALFEIANHCLHFGHIKHK